MSRIWSTRMPILRSPLLKTTTCAGSWRPAVSAAPGSRMGAREASGRIRPRYCTTRLPPACSILARAISSSRATSESGTARRSNAPARNSRNVWRSLPERSWRWGAVVALGLRRGLFARFLHHTGQLPDSRNVQDQGHAAIVHDGGAGIAVQALQLLAERLHHDFLGVANTIHHQAKLPVFRLQD